MSEEEKRQRGKAGRRARARQREAKGRPRDVVDAHLPGDQPATPEKAGDGADGIDELLALREPIM